MFLAIVVAALALLPAAPKRIERLVALARLDAAVRYFNPVVATRPPSWDSLFAAHAVRIADAPTSREYRRASLARRLAHAKRLMHHRPPYPPE